MFQKMLQGGSGGGGEKELNYAHNSFHYTVKTKITISLGFRPKHVLVLGKSPSTTMLGYKADEDGAQTLLNYYGTNGLVKDAYNANYGDWITITEDGFECYCKTTAMATENYEYFAFA